MLLWAHCVRDGEFVLLPEGAVTKPWAPAALPAWMRSHPCHPGGLCFVYAVKDVLTLVILPAFWPSLPGGHTALCMWKMP